MAVVDLPSFAVGVWADTVWAAGVWAESVAAVGDATPKFFLGVL